MIFMRILCVNAAFQVVATDIPLTNTVARSKDDGIVLRFLGNVAFHLTKYPLFKSSFC